MTHLHVVTDPLVPEGKAYLMPSAPVIHVSAWEPLASISDLDAVRAAGRRCKATLSRLARTSRAPGWRKAVGVDVELVARFTEHVAHTFVDGAVVPATRYVIIGTVRVEQRGRIEP